MAESVGGISASVTMDDSTLDAGLNKLRSAIDSTKVQIGMLAAALANGSVSASEYAGHMAKLEANLRKLEASEASLAAAHQGNAAATKAAADAAEAEAKAVAEATAAQKAHEAALTSTMVPLGNLIQEGLRYQDVLEKIKAAELAANNSHGTMSAAGNRVAASMGGGSVGKGGDGAKAAAMNLADVAVKSNIARQRLMAFGNTLDDLQYVGEMGLRPIINNIMQISPAVGIALLALDQLRKHGESLETVIKGVGDYWLGSFEKASKGSNSVATGIANIISGLKEAKKWLDDFGAGWTALTGADKREQEKKVKEFEETASSGEQKRAKAVAEAIDAYGPRKFLGEAVDKRKEIDPLLRAGNADAERDERSRLIDLYNKAKEGDPNAAAALAARTKGTGVGVQIGAAMKGPQSDADKAAEKKLDDEHKATIEAQEDAQERATETAVRALQSRYNRLSASGVQTTTNGIAREIRRTGLPQEQGMLEPTERKLRANFEEMISGRMAEKGISREQAQREFLEEEKAKDKAEAEKRAKPERDAQKATDKADKALEKQLDAAEKINDAMETDSDLRYRLKNTVKPYETGKSMGLDEYESSIKSQSGEDKLERRMHEAVEILKKIQDNNEKIQVIARKAR